MKQHPAHKHAVESIIERCKREGYGITFSNQEIDDLLGLKQPAHCSREEREDFKCDVLGNEDNLTLKNFSGSETYLKSISS